MISSEGLLAKKVGMTQIFDKDGNIVPVTVLEAGPCVVLENITQPKERVKLGYEEVRESRTKKPQLGYFKKLGVPPMRHVQEFALRDYEHLKEEQAEQAQEAKADQAEEAQAAEEKTEVKEAASPAVEQAGPLKVGQKVSVNIFRAGDFVTVTGTSIGKGFQGGMKRWNWAGGPGGHGSMHHRRVGSIGSSADPSRVFRGRNMPGHMGNERVTVQNLRVMQVDLDNNIILVNGAVPGKKNAYLTVKISQKKKYRSLEEVKAVHAVKRNPMKQSKAKAKGKK